jgi:arginase
MEQAALMALPFEEAVPVDEPSLGEQTERLAGTLPERPVVLGGCCCAHVGAVAGLAQRHGRIALVWFDGHGDLNTPETSPSGNEWGMPFRMLLDDLVVRPEDSILIGARNLDDPERVYIDETALADDPAELSGVLAGVSGAYIAFDGDVLDPSEIACFMPEPDGMSLDTAVALVEEVAATTEILGIGFTGLVVDDGNPPRLMRLVAAAGLER